MTTTSPLAPEEAASQFIDAVKRSARSGTGVDLNSAAFRGVPEADIQAALNVVHTCDECRRVIAAAQKDKVQEQLVAVQRELAEWAEQKDAAIDKAETRDEAERVSWQFEKQARKLTERFNELSARAFNATRMATRLQAQQMIHGVLAEP
jgi:hypothetical protein